MWRFTLALMAVLAVKCGIFALETNFHIIAQQLPPVVMGLKVTPTLIAFAASLVMLTTLSVKWPRIIAAVVISSASEAVAVLPYAGISVHDPYGAFWLINAPLSIIAGLWLLDRRSLWYVGSWWRVWAKLQLIAALALMNLALYRIYNNGGLGDDMMIYVLGGVSGAFLWVLLLDILGANRAQKWAAPEKRIAELERDLVKFQARAKVLEEELRDQMGLDQDEQIPGIPPLAEPARA